MKKLLFFLLIIFIAFLACQNTHEKQAAPAPASGHAVVVQEVIHANAYTYLNVSENGQSFWIAITKADIAIGQKLYYERGLEMKNFESKDLNRTFESIYFVDQISDQPMAAPHAHPENTEHTGKPAVEQLHISVPPATGGVTIAEIFANRKKFQNETVRIRGQVVKVNSGIMGRNWVHLQDGTSSQGEFDLTVTTQDNVNVGDTVTFDGTVALEKDFGAGYFYNVIVEQATLVSEQAL